MFDVELSLILIFKRVHKKPYPLSAQWSELRGHVWLFSKIGISKYVENQYFKIPLIQMFILN